MVAANGYCTYVGSPFLVRFHGFTLRALLAILAVACMFSFSRTVLVPRSNCRGGVVVGGPRSGVCLYYVFPGLSCVRSFQ